MPGSPSEPERLDDDRLLESDELGLEVLVDDSLDVDSDWLVAVTSLELSEELLDDRPRLLLDREVRVVSVTDDGLDDRLLDRLRLNSVETSSGRLLELLVLTDWDDELELRTKLDVLGDELLAVELLLVTPTLVVESVDDWVECDSSHDE